MRLLDGDVIENLLHSSSISKGIERTMEHIINELALDNMWIIHYEEEQIEPRVIYNWKNDGESINPELAEYVKSIDDWYHFEEDDLFVVYDRTNLSDVERKFYEELGYETAIEFQMRNHGIVVGYIFLGWNKKRELLDDEIGEVHILAKLMNDLLIRQYYEEFLGENDWKLFRIANTLTETMIFTIDENYRIRYSNNYAQEEYPSIKNGDFCYRALKGENSPCKNCIIRNADWNKEERYLFVPYLDASFRVNVNDVKMQDNSTRYLLTMQKQNINETAERRETIDRKFIFSLQGLYKDLIAVEIRRDTFFNLLEEDVTHKYSYSMDFVLKWLSKVHIDDKQKFIECFDINFLQNSYLSGVKRKEIDFRYRTHEGSYHCMNGNIFFEQSTNKDVMVYILFQDVEQVRSAQIEEQRQLRESLMAARSAAELKGEVLANISHDIRTPLGGIISMVSVAKQVYKEENKLLDCLSNIDGYADHMMEVMDLLLETVNVDQDAITIAKQNFRLEYLLNRVDIAVRENVEKKNIQFHISSQCRYQELVGDEIRVYQVLCTLIHNAISYIPISGELNLTAKLIAVDGKTVYIRFLLEDTGNGLNEKMKESIFGFSHDAESGIIDEEHFELSLAEKVIQLMGGEISMQVNESGTMLSFTLPFELPEKEKAVKRKATPPMGNFTGKHILLAEDTEMARDAIRAVLEVAGFVVDTVENGRQAVIQFVSKPAFTYDAVLMDVHMPFMDGREATKCIRISGKEDGESIPVIGLMTNTYEEDIQESLRAGMQAHLAKPVEVDLLYKVLRDVIPDEEEL